LSREQCSTITLQLPLRSKLSNSKVAKIRASKSFLAVFDMKSVCEVLSVFEIYYFDNGHVTV